jgi:hypothetical protein
VHAKNALPEIEIYAALVVLVYLVDQKRYDQVRGAAPPQHQPQRRTPCIVLFSLKLTLNAFVLLLCACAAAAPAHAAPPRSGTQRDARSQTKTIATATVQRLAAFNRRSMDLVAARIYFYLSLAHERTGTLSDVRRCARAPCACATLTPPPVSASHPLATTHLGAVFLLVRSLPVRQHVPKRRIGGQVQSSDLIVNLADRTELASAIYISLDVDRP